MLHEPCTIDSNYSLLWNLLMKKKVGSAWNQIGSLKNRLELLVLRVYKSYIVSTILIKNSNNEFWFFTLFTFGTYLLKSRDSCRWTSNHTIENCDKSTYTATRSRSWNIPPNTLFICYIHTPHDGLKQVLSNVPWFPLYITFLYPLYTRYSTQMGF